MNGKSFYFSDILGASLICLELCGKTFETHLHNEYADYRYAATLHGLHLRNFLRHSDEPGRLGVFCKKVFKPFANCTKKCPESLGKFYNLLQYQSFSILCWAEPPSFHNALPCLREAEASTRKSCSEFRRTHARNLNGFLKHLATVNKTGVKNLAGMKADTPEFCRSMKNFLDCEKRIESEKCGSNIVELEQQMHYGTFWSFRALLRRADLHIDDLIDDYQCDWIPEPTSFCKTDDHVDHPMNDDNNQNVENADRSQESGEKVTEMKKLQTE
uniref:Uncharacterized protein n=1 Tax=Romanomermis culicivorax TaxID=13658 RepID=A0A915KPV7_ROMCU